MMILALLLIVVSLILIMVSRIISYKAEKARRTYKILNGEVIYSDLDTSAKPLFSKRYGLSGKPDYVIKRKEQYLPVEVKIGGHERPQNNHIFQLAAYCQLVEENFKVFVPYGMLIYSDGSQFKIPFDPKIRFELENTINEMRNCIKRGRIDFDIKEAFKCKECSMRKYCNINSIKNKF